MKYIKDLPKCTKSVTMFSDCCGGQNRNKYVAAGFSYIVRTCEKIEAIDQMFLESGHTQMEVDSMHSCIEHAKKTCRCVSSRRLGAHYSIGKTEATLRSR